MAPIKSRPRSAFISVRLARITVAIGTGAPALLPYITQFEYAEEEDDNDNSFWRNMKFAAAGTRSLGCVFTAEGLIMSWISPPISFAIAAALVTVYTDTDLVARSRGYWYLYHVVPKFNTPLVVKLSPKLPTKRI